jgi:hypothetical protein
MKNLLIFLFSQISKLDNKNTKPKIIAFINKIFSNRNNVEIPLFFKI